MLAPETITALAAGAVGIVVAIIAVLALDRLWPPLLRPRPSGRLIEIHKVIRPPKTRPHIFWYNKSRSRKCRLTRNKD